MSQHSQVALEPPIRNPLPGEGVGATVKSSINSGSEAWHVLVVESKSHHAESLLLGLRRHGHRVDRAETGGAALQAYTQADLVLIDLELPDLDGLEVCRAIRTVSDTPIIALTARATELDRVLGLQAGADDYMVKPYGFRELLARMHAVMRRARPQPRTADVISRGPLRIDVGSREVSLDGKPIGVTRKEFDVLYLLAANPDNVIPRKRLMQQVWGDSWSRRTVDTHVSSLRSKLGDSDWIVTIRGVGFRLGSV
ncbi:response regulator transcription factor [Streptomyces capillispiralis]|uniref:Sensory transduction protein RegX3 n=1 Tax=Streptomyces capillispiralis TaxID=68182 RepID=A0A561TCC2_9ACTN|nr:response regulator transcription factor [Streptomyces capillispiralis]TWF84752.1 DNA-binding response OmpR family regulator [Streptomyces capillispiralis]